MQQLTEFLITYGLPALLTLATLATVGGLGYLGTLALTKIKNAKLLEFVSFLIDTCKTAVAHVGGGLKQTLLEAAKDGVIDAAEKKKLRDEAIRLAVEIGGLKLREGALKFFGVSGANFADWLAGWIERVLDLTKLEKSTATVASALTASNLTLPTTLGALGAAAALNGALSLPASKQVLTVSPTTPPGAQ